MALVDWPKCFDNTLLRDLRAEAPTLSPTESRSQILDVHYTLVPPTPAPNPTLVAYSAACGRLIGLEPDDFASDEFLRIFSGNIGSEGWDTWATIYGVHGSGRFGGQRGDGRAISIGQVGGNEIQLKGAGRTPYSRRSDGRAVLRSTIREFLASEHMAALGVPTTRSLCVVASGARVMRSWYDLRDGVATTGQQRQEQPVQRFGAEPGAIGTRVASSFLRFGQLELFWQRRDYRLMREVVEHALAREFFHLKMQLFGESLTVQLVEMLRNACEIPISPCRPLCRPLRLPRSLAHVDCTRSLTHACVVGTQRARRSAFESSGCSERNVGVRPAHGCSASSRIRAHLREVVSSSARP